jgi:hypothetical protein
MRAVAFLLLLGSLPVFVAAETRRPLPNCVPVERDPGDLPFLDVRQDGTFRIASTREQLDRAPMLVGTWAFTSLHLMLVVPAGGCASAPELERVVMVFVEQGNALYAAMSSTATSAVVNGNPQLACPTYDAAGVETYRRTDGEAASPSPVGVWQGHRVAGAHCYGVDLV